MADIGTLFIGFSGDDYETLIKNATIAAYLDGKVTQMSKELPTIFSMGTISSFLKWLRMQT